LKPSEKRAILKKKKNSKVHFDEGLIDICREGKKGRPKGKRKNQHSSGRASGRLPKI